MIEHTFESSPPHNAPAIPPAYRALLPLVLTHRPHRYLTVTYVSSLPLDMRPLPCHTGTTNNERPIMDTLTAGQTYTARTTARNAAGVRIYRDITFTASRDQAIEPFIRNRETTVDQDRVFRADRRFGSSPLLVVAGSIARV